MVAFGFVKYPVKKFCKLLVSQKYILTKDMPKVIIAVNLNEKNSLESSFFWRKDTMIEAIIKVKLNTN
jgi:hypothetical protein